MIRYKTKQDINKLRAAGKILAKILHDLGDLVEPGVTTLDLENAAVEMMHDYKVKPLFKGHRGYPAVCCISVNDEIVHGIPNKHKVLMEGDIVGIDSGLWKDGVCVDSAVTYPVGIIDSENIKLLEITKQGLALGIEQAKIGNRIGDIGYAIQTYVESAGLAVVRGLVGHGVGFDLWEEPQVPNFGNKGEGVVLKENLVIAIEPMVTRGGHEIYTLDDSWTIVTNDGSWAAQFEHTIAITAKGPQILTAYEA